MLSSVFIVLIEMNCIEVIKVILIVMTTKWYRRCRRCRRQRILTQIQSCCKFVICFLLAFWSRIFLTLCDLFVMYSICIGLTGTLNELNIQCFCCCINACLVSSTFFEGLTESILSDFFACRGRWCGILTFIKFCYQIVFQFLLACFLIFHRWIK